MGIDNELKEIDIKNHTCCFNDIINVIDIDIDNILLDEKSYGSFLIYDVSYKTPYIAKPLRIIFDKLDGYIRKYDRTKYVSLFHPYKEYQRIFDKVRFPIMLKSNISVIYSHKYTKIKNKSEDNLPLEKTLNMHN